MRTLLPAAARCGWRLLLSSLCLAVSLAGQAGAANFTGDLAAYRRGDFSAAFAGLEPLARGGDASSQYYVGLMVLNGQGVPKNEAQAFQWFEKSALQGYAKAQNALGELYFHARGTPRDYALAQSWFRKAANAQLAIAQRNLGETYAYALAPPDYDKAVFWLAKAARQGDDIDQLALANLYRYQAQVQDAAKSAFWMRKSANQGNAEAQNTLGSYYRSGTGVPQDAPKALYWYQRAAGQGHPDAPYSIAQLYLRGQGLPADPAIAVDWFCQAARQGNPNAIYELQQAGTKATACLIELANGGSMLAQEELGRFYENSIGEVHDYAAAASWSRKAAERGSAGALNRLGDLYAQGSGVPKDPVIAQMLYILAKPKLAGSPHGSHIRQPLSDLQLSEAQSLAQAWKEGMPLPDSSQTGASPPSTQAPRP